MSDVTQDEQTPASEPTEQELVDEGDIAADYIEELLDIADLDGDIDIDARAGRAYVSVSAAESADLRVLSKPDTVAALQELTRLTVQNPCRGQSQCRRTGLLKKWHWRSMKD